MYAMNSSLQYSSCDFLFRQILACIFLLLSKILPFINLLWNFKLSLLTINATHIS